MTPGQIPALIVAILLFLAGGCVLVLGIWTAINGHADADITGVRLLIAAILLAPSVQLFWSMLRGSRSLGRPISGINGGALGCAILLLLPGGCFLAYGISMMSPKSLLYGDGSPWLLIAGLILFFAAIMFVIAFTGGSPPPPAAPGGSSQTPPNPEP